MSGRAHQSPVALWLEGAWREAELLREELVRDTEGGNEERRWLLAAHGGVWELSGPEGGPYALGRRSGPGARLAR